jgi:hypothetical protein
VKNCTQDDDENWSSGELRWTLKTANTSELSDTTPRGPLTDDCCDLLAAMHDLVNPAM